MKFSESDNVGFEDLVVDLVKRKVERAGTLLPVKDKSFDLLRYLLERYPETASHEELMASVWAGRVVSQDTVAQRVKLLRKALGDTGKEERYVASVHGSGYRLAGSPRVLPAGGTRVSVLAVPNPSRRLGLVLLIAVLAVLLLIYKQEGLVHGIKHLFKHAFYGQH